MPRILISIGGYARGSRAPQGYHLTSASDYQGHYFTFKAGSAEAKAQAAAYADAHRDFEDRRKSL